MSSSTWVTTAKLCSEIDRRFDEAAQEFGMTVVEAHIINALFRHDGQQASALAAQVGRLPTSFTPNLDNLQEKGLITRKPHPTDRRAVQICLTDKAKELREPFVMRFADAEAEAAAHLNGWIDERLAKATPTHVMAHE